MTLIAPELAEPALVPGHDRAAGGTTLADPHQEGPAISGEQLGVAPESQSCGAFMLWLLRGFPEELSALHSRVLDMLTEARAPST